MLFRSGFRPHDLVTAYLPFLHSVGSQIGLSDPVFMAKYGKQPVTDIPDYPYDPSKFEKLLADGDPETKELIFLAAEWIKQVNSGTFRAWEQLKHVRDNWDGPLILKGILSVEVRYATVNLDYCWPSILTQFTLTGRRNGFGKWRGWDRCVKPR